MSPLGPRNNRGNFEKKHIRGGYYEKEYLALRRDGKYKSKYKNDFFLQF